MTWENWGTKWEIDHIKPLRNFNLNNRDEFLKANHYSNLRPLLKELHIQKSSIENSIRR
jgi:hypothetical protein